MIELTDVTTFEELHARVLAEARRIADADGATFVLREGPNCFYAAEDAIAPLWAGQRFPLGECISGWAMLHGETAVVPNIEIDERIPVEAYRPTFVRSLAMVPMGTDEPRGAVGVYWRQIGRRADDATLGKLAELAAAAGAAVRRLGLDAAPWAPNFKLPA